MNVIVYYFGSPLKACGRVSLEAEDNNTKFFGSEKYRTEVLECMSHTKYLNSASKMSSCSCVNSGMYGVV
jgi:hypothetical protein